MIDFRILTFITLYKTRNYTKTADILSMTHPAVTQHIKYLETHYNSKLINYENKNITLTECGEIFYKYALNIYGASINIKRTLDDIKDNESRLNFGATLTIGEFTMPNILKKYIEQYPTSKINMEINNTQILINKVLDGSLDFAFIEGNFNKDDFYTALLKQDSFVMAVSPNSSLVSKPIVELNDLKNERLIIREKGSGSRDISEKMLENAGYSLDDFCSVMEIGNVNVIKKLVKNNLGITFMFKEALKNDLKNKSLNCVHLANISLKREFNFICLHDSILKNEYTEFFNFCRSQL